MKPVLDLPQPMNESWQEWADSLTLSQADALRQCLETNPYRALLSPITAWRLITGNGVVVEASEEETLTDKVRRVIARMPEPFNARQVDARLLDVRAGAAAQVMYKLFEQGELQRVGRKISGQGFSYCRAGTGWPVLVGQDSHTATEQQNSHSGSPDDAEALLRPSKTKNGKAA